MMSGRPERMALIAVLFGAFLSAGPAPAQETQCPQTRPREGNHSRRAADYIEQARKQDSPQDARGYLAYGNSTQRGDVRMGDQLELFSSGEWRDIHFYADDIAANTIRTEDLTRAE